MLPAEGTLEATPNTCYPWSKLEQAGNSRRLGSKTTQKWSTSWPALLVKPHRPETMSRFYWRVFDQHVTPYPSLLLCLFLLTRSHSLKTGGEQRQWQKKTNITLCPYLRRTPEHVWPQTQLCLSFEGPHLLWFLPNGSAEWHTFSFLSVTVKTIYIVRADSKWLCLEGLPCCLYEVVTGMSM